MIEESIDFEFTFANIEKYFRQGMMEGYEFLTCQDYVKYKELGFQHKIIINRVDIDASVKKSERLLNIFNKLKIKATFFVRLHANEYNPFSFENYRILKSIRDSGHEIGYHSEVIDQATIWQESAASCLKRDIIILQEMLNITVNGVASHGGLTGLNNLDFWLDKIPSQFGLIYEAYDTQPNFNLFNNSFFISDSNWTSWKCYLNGKLLNNVKKNLGEHLQAGHRVIYSLIHPETYFDKHFYE